MRGRERERGREATSHAGVHARIPIGDGDVCARVSSVSRGLRLLLLRQGSRFLGTACEGVRGRGKTEYKAAGSSDTREREGW